MAMTPALDGSHAYKTSSSDDGSCSIILTALGACVKSKIPRFIYGATVTLFFPFLLEVVNARSAASRSSLAVLPCLG